MTKLPTLTGTPEIHIHDLSMLTGYCAGWSLKQLIQEGAGRIPGKNHLRSGKASGHALQSNGELSGNYAERMGRSTGLFLL